MIFESYGVEKYLESNVKDSETAIHLIKYDPPPTNQPAAGVGANPHTDKSLLTILDFNLPGLEVLSKDQSQWLPVGPRPGAFTIFVGDQLKAWSNGRLHIAPHKVSMRGEKERYSYALFASPKNEAVVEAPKELVDEEHPLLFRPFKNMDFLRFYYSNIYMDNALQGFAGLAVN
ncbi:Oxoglutarate/iron-dependent dioxygenase [Macleaya cordata]|uniref:Oxoglutarate/iron-dependent dioxygenase n=1 Tax=Macleaya cordata TaxID=56857 RepID=A0A200RC31_MACCD|nr:Oxoglutarate/iron-dependent dioxygenase [Macleaya cordata]